MSRMGVRKDMLECRRCEGSNVAHSGRNHFDASN